MKTIGYFFQWLTVVLLISVNVLDTMAQGPYPSSTSSLSVCQNSIEPYGVVFTAGSTYTWTISDPSGIITDGATPNLKTVNWTKPGDFTLQVVETNQFGCIGAPVSINVKVNALPIAPTAVNVTECFDGNVHTGSATAGSGESIVWYDAATGGNIITAPGATSPGSYTAYAAAKNNTTTCESSARTLVTVTIYALPIAPTAVNVTECFDGNVHTGSATAGAGESIVWYDAATGGNITTAPGATAPGSYTAYAASKNNTTTCESSARTLVTVTIHALPIAPTAVNVTECFDGTVHTGSATADTGESIVWYDAATGGNIITAPGATAPGSYTAYAAAKNNTTTCESSARTLVTVTIYALPIAPTAVNVTECFDGNVHTGSATAGAGESIVWYDAATGGNIITAPGATAPGSYTAYAAAKNNTTTCESPARTLVTVTIYAPVSTSPIYHN